MSIERIRIPYYNCDEQYSSHTGLSVSGGWAAGRGQ